MDMTHNSKSTLDLLNDAIAADPNDADLYAERAIKLIESGESQEDALRDADKAVELEPNEAKSYAVRAVCYMKLHLRNLERAIKLTESGESKENALWDANKAVTMALNDFTKAIELDPSQAVFYMGRANALQSALNDYNRAINDYTKAIEIDSNQAQWYAERGYLYWWTKDEHDLAISDYTKAIEIEPNEAKWYDGRARVYRWGIKDHDQALSDYSKAIDLEPNQAQWYAERARVYRWGKEDHGQAIYDYSKAIELDSNQAEWYAERGYVYWWTKDEYDLALNDYTKATELDPNRAEWYAERARVYRWGKEDYDQAINDYTKAIELDSNQAQWYAERGYVYWWAKDEYDLALNEYAKAIELDPEQAEWYAERAAVYRKANEYALALNDYVKSIELDPSKVEYWANFAEYVSISSEYWDNKELTGIPISIIQCYTNAINLEPEQAKWYIGRANVYKLLDKHTSAITDFIKAADLFETTGDYISAISCYTAAIEIKPNRLLYLKRADANEKERNYDAAIKDIISYIELDSDKTEKSSDAKPEFCSDDEMEHFKIKSYFDNLKHLQVSPSPDSCDLYARSIYYRVLINRSHRIIFSNTYTKNTDFESAIKDFTAAIELDPDNIIGYVKRAGAWLRKKDYEQTVACCDEVLSFDPEVADIYFIRAVAYRERDNLDDPSNYFWFFHSNDYYERAKTDLIKAFELSNSLQVFYHLIFLLYNNKKYDDVVDMAKRFNWENLNDKGSLVTNTYYYCKYENQIYWWVVDDDDFGGEDYSLLPDSDRIKAAVGSAYFETGDYELSITILDSIESRSLNVINNFVQNTEYYFTPKELVWQKVSEQRIETARIEERNRIIADLSHSIKNLIATVIDPLQHIKQTASLEPQIIDNAIRGASLIREIVNAMNLSFKGSIGDFQYDARHNVTGGAMTIAEMVLESLKHSGGNMFDGKYFEKFMRKYFPNREAYTAARADWDRATASNDLARVTAALNTHFLTPEIVLDGAEACRMGNEKGSAVKLLILFQEMIFNAVKYASFVSRAERFVQIRFGSEGADLTFTVENAFDPQVRVKTSGLGHVIIKNFALILGDEPRIHTGSNRYAVTVRFPDFWKGRKGA